MNLLFQHLRFPSSYQIISTTLCGFLLDHDDSITNSSDGVDGQGGGGG